MLFFNTSSHFFVNSCFPRIFVLFFSNISPYWILEMLLFLLASSTFCSQFVLVFSFHIQIYTCGLDHCHGLLHQWLHTLNWLNLWVALQKNHTASDESLVSFLYINVLYGKNECFFQIESQGELIVFCKNVFEMCWFWRKNIRPGEDELKTSRRRRQHSNYLSPRRLGRRNVVTFLYDKNRQPLCDLIRYWLCSTSL